MSSAQQQTIVDGPSKWDLIMSFADRQIVNTRKVRIRTEEGRHYELVLNSLAHEDGSGESFLIRGYSHEVDKDVPAGRIAARGSVPNPTRGFSGYFHTKTRKGWIKVAA